MQARWLLIRGESLFENAATTDEARAMLEASADMFRSVAPGEPRYVEALIDLGSLALEESRFSSASVYYQQAIDAAKANPQLEGSLLNPFAGLALARKRLGDFQGAAAAFARGTEIAEHTYGHDTQSYWRIASDWAQFRYERGEREPALAAFGELLHELPHGQPGFRNATDSMEAAQVLRKYGYVLAIDGQGSRAVELLQQARAVLVTTASHPFDTGQVELDLGTAYAADERIPEAHQAIVSALSIWRSRRAPATKIATGLERLGRFLISQSDFTGAESALREALQLADGRATETAVLSTADLATIEVSRKDTSAALFASESAMNLLAHIEGYYDVRIEPFVWDIRASALLLADDREGARTLALKAREAALKYYGVPNPATGRPPASLMPKLNRSLTADFVGW
jgi:tetratricopeptide (TPR) repeat protein